MTGKVRKWAELKTTNFGRDDDKCIALLPVGAVEQHGPHLPLGTDTFVVEALVARLEEKLDAKTEVLVLPTQSIGESTEHSDFPGTLSQDAETLIENWFTIGEAVAETGIRKLAILNMHGGQPQIVDLVAKRLRAACDMLIARVNPFLLEFPDGLFPANEMAFGFHGGEVETSLMLAIAPELVDMSAAKDFPNYAADMAKSYKMLRAEGPSAIAWQSQDLNPEGVTGNASAADAERGAKLLDYLAMRIAETLGDMANFPLSNLRDVTQ